MEIISTETHRSHLVQHHRLLHTPGLAPVSRVEPDHEVDVLLALLGDPLEEDVGVNAASGGRDADYGRASSVGSLEQAGEEFRV